MFVTNKFLIKICSLLKENLSGGIPFEKILVNLARFVSTGLCCTSQTRQCYAIARLRELSFCCIYLYKWDDGY